MKKLLKNLLLFVTLAVSTLSAQTRYYSATAQATAVGANSPLSYGLVAQIWNPGSTAITLDYAEAQNYATVPYAPADGTPVFGWGLSNIEESQCIANASVGIGTMVASQARVSSQPCTPNGLVYGTQPNGSFNYTPTNYAGIARHIGEHGQIHVPIIIPAHQGVTVYFAFWQGAWPVPIWKWWQGQLSVNFFWHE